MTNLGIESFPFLKASPNGQSSLMQHLKTLLGGRRVSYLAALFCVGKHV